MPRPIRTELPLPVIDDVLVERASLRSATAGTRLIETARKRARHMIDAAENEAEAIRRLARAEGFRDGFGEALDMLGPWFQQHQVICSEALLLLRAEVRARLSDALLDPPVVAHVIEAVFGSSDSWQGQYVRVRLPAPLAAQAADLTRAVEQAGGAALEILPSQDKRLTIECGNHVFVFDAEELAESASGSTCRRDPGIDVAVLEAQVRRRIEP
jgi:hypothetical protein